MRNIIVCLLALTILSTSAIADPGKNKDKGKSLPPGLAKNLDRGKSLPPGWQKKLVVGNILEPNIYASGRVIVPVGKNGSITLEIEGRLLKLRENTREIIEILN